jgi:hypothetical protein
MMTGDEFEIDAPLDDEEQWGEPIKVTSSKRLDAIVSVRFSPDELERIRAAAPEGNVSNYIRSATLRATADTGSDWKLRITLNGTAQRGYGYVAAENGMVLENWDPPTILLTEAS